MYPGKLGSALAPLDPVQLLTNCPQLERAPSRF